MQYMIFDKPGFTFSQTRHLKILAPTNRSVPSRPNGKPEPDLGENDI